jgi:hypothetical protein
MLGRPWDSVGIRDHRRCARYGDTCAYSVCVSEVVHVSRAACTPCRSLLRVFLMCPDSSGSLSLCCVVVRPAPGEDGVAGD